MDLVISIKSAKHKFFILRIEIETQLVKVKIFRISLLPAYFSINKLMT